MEEGRFGEGKGEERYMEGQNNSVLVRGSTIGAAQYYKQNVNNLTLNNHTYNKNKTYIGKNN